MTEVQRRTEVGEQTDPDHGAEVMSEADVDSGTHRRFVGGRWEEIGRHQLDFLVSRGLTPEMTFLDVGCGSLRAGVHLVDYLMSGNYYGIDINPTLIEAGYDHELSDEGRSKLPVENLAATDRFDSDFGVMIDMAIANSIFTHVSLNHIRLCLARLAPTLRPGASFYATFFEQPTDFPVDGVFGKAPRRWFYERDDLVWASERLPLTAEYIGDWGHPRGQMMMQYRRV